MSIKSNAFGHVKLTKDDAKKFRNQVLYSRASATATETVERGVELSRKFHETGVVIIEAKEPVGEKEPA